MNLTRDFVSTAYIIHGGKVLFVLHKKIGLWLPPGGHIDEHELPTDSAVREAKEETGLDIEIVGEEEEYDRVRILAHPKIVQLEDIEPGHQHIDLIYFARLKDPNQKLKLNVEESDDLKWFSREELDNDKIHEVTAKQAKRAMDELK